MLKIKGNEIKKPNFTSSFSRRSIKIQNNIFSTLKQLGVSRDYIEVSMQNMPQLKNKAFVKWWFEGRNLKYTYSLMNKFIDNLYVIDKILEIEINKLIENEITLDQFQREFSEDADLEKQLIKARKILNVAEDENDFEVIAKSYKTLARKYHPDMSSGDHVMFQKINAAHKLIQKELN